MSQITPQPGILDIDLYVGGKSTLSGRDDVLKLSSNENPLGAPASAVEALTQAATGVHSVSYTHLTLPTICSV